MKITGECKNFPVIFFEINEITKITLYYIIETL
jgi:hypothetical protein